MRNSGPDPLIKRRKFHELAGHNALLVDVDRLHKLFEIHGQNALKAINAIIDDENEAREALGEPPHMLKPLKPDGSCCEEHGYSIWTG